MAGHFLWRPIAAAAAAFALNGCATFSEDGGMGEVAELTVVRTGQPVGRHDPEDATRRQLTESLLSRPLSPDDAVRLAFANNRMLQASLHELGIAEAELVQAGRLRNPGFSFGRLRGGENLEIERGVLLDLVGLLTMPLRTDIERRRFEQARWQAASEAVRLAAEVRRAYFEAVAARQVLVFAETVRTSADAGAELARRMAAIGNFSALDAQRQQLFYAEATAQLARARHHATATQEGLIRLLGLEQGKTLLLPDRLPELPLMPRTVHDAEALALRQRLDLQAALRRTEMLAASLGLARTTGFVNVLHAGYQNKNETGEERANGYEIELELPLFDWGGARSRRAEAQYMAALHRTGAIAQRAQSEVREAYSAYRTAFDLARHYRDEIVPLRKAISDEVLLRYNGMLIGVFELLADAREQAIAVTAAIEAQRDFWIAHTRLDDATQGSGIGNAPSTLRAVKPAANPDAGGH